MIKIDKPSAPPVLTERGAKETANLKRSYSANREQYRSGQKSFDFKPTIYGHTEVKEALKKAQHNKCCFCETKLVGDFGHVEHYRPKGRVKPDHSTKALKPGYYWLTYNWDNLLLACSKCNTSYKRDYFPLKEESKRARSHQDAIEEEEPLIINPATEDPEEYMEFKGSVPRAIKGNVRGKATIDRLGLACPKRDCLNRRQVCFFKNRKAII